MEYFVDSDVARLVLGYLKEKSYHKTFQCFLKECCHLQEIYNLVKAGRQPRQISHLNLIIILEEWGKFKFQNDDADESEQNAVSPTSSSSFDMADETLVGDNDVTRKKGTKRSPKRNKKITLVSKKIKSPTLKSPKSCNVGVLSPRKLRSGKSVRKDGTYTEDGTGHDSPARSSVKSPARTLETPEKSPAVNFAVAEKNNFPSEHRLLPSDTSFNRSPAKHVQFSGTNKTFEVRNGAKTDEVLNSVQDTQQDESVSKDKDIIDKSGGVELESVHAIDGNRLSESLHRSSQDLTVYNDRNICDGAKAAILSDTYAKTDAMPPSESVGIADKCISWINGNVRDETPDRDHATAGSNGASSEYSSSEPNFKSCDTGDNGISKHGQDIIVIPMSHEPVIPILKTPKKMPPSLYKSSGELITPVKLLLVSGEHISRSPRRKKPKTPRKRNSEVSPVSVVSAMSVDPMFEKILGDHRLHQKLAETCNSIVQNQIKTNSGREKKETSATERVSPAPTLVSIDQETLAASKSLEEILEIDNNSHLEFLSDNFDMSDPAYESLFKLFGTDRETFSGYLRREKEKELAQMEAEVEELERSNHEILCSNFGMSHADTSYETDEIGVNSPHHHLAISSQDLFSSQPSTSSLTPIPGDVTSTPCIVGVPVSFTPLLRSHELGSSPVRSSPGMFGGSVSDKRTSPGSTATQPFSPAFSHHSDFNPPTPRNHQRLSKYMNDPRSPRHCIEAPYSNPATPQQPSSPHGSHLVHSTPTGSDSVRSHFCQSSPIHPTSDAVSSGKLPPHCSPLVKGDLHSGSPRMVQRNTCQTQENNSFPTSAGASSELYFNSQHKLNSSNVLTSSNNDHLSNVVTPCFMNLLNDDEHHTLTPTEPCSTIDNSIGCLSLPPSSGRQQYVCPDGEKSEVKRGKTRGKERKKQKGNTFSTLKGLLSKPLRHRNTVPLGLTAGELHEALKNSEKRGEHNLTFHSPNGKSTFKVPILDCQNDLAGIGVLGMSGTDSEADHTISVYNESLDTSAQYSIAPENQATRALVNAIKAGNTSDVLQKMQSKKSVSSKKKSKSEKKLKKIKKKNKKNESDKNDESEISGSTPIVPHDDLDPNQDVYTATPVTALSKATTVRALNFGPNADDQAVGSYRTIFPKMPASVTPSVLILNTNQLITPAHKVVVNATPGSMNKGNLIASHPANCGGKDKIKILPKVKTKSPSESHGLEDAAMDIPIETPKAFENMKSVREITEDTIESTKPPVSDKKKYRTSSCSMISTDIGSVSRKVDIEEKNKDESVVLDSQKVVDIDKNTPNVKSKEELETVEKTDTNKQADNESFSRRITRSKKKHDKSREKLKVKLPVHKSPKIKKHENNESKACIPFYFKPKSKIESTVKNAPLNMSKKKKSDRNKTSSKKIFKSVPVIVVSESSEDDTLRKNLMEPSTPDKININNKSDECVMNNDDEPSSKEVLLEKIGLTPKKNVTDIEKVLRSPNRANALDVLAEWQSSPLNSRKRSVTPNTRNRFSRAEIENSPMKAPSTPKRKTPAKKLFTSPCKEQSSIQTRKDHKPGATAKRVSVIIDRLKRNNPDTRLPSPAKVVDKDPEFSDCVDLDSEFIDTCEEMENNCNTKAESGRQNNKRSGRDKKKRKKTPKREIEKESLEESGVLDSEETIAETINVDNESKDEDTSGLSAVAVFEKLSGNSEDILNEVDHSNSPMKKDDVESDEDLVNEIDNENNQEANELDQAVASIVFDADSSGRTITTPADIRTPPDITLEDTTDVNNHAVDLNANNNSDSENFEIHAPSVELDAVDSENVVNEVDEVNSGEKCDVLSLQSEGISDNTNAASSSSRKERRRKHKHRRHKHRRQHNDDLGAPGDIPVGDLFVSPEEHNEHKHRRHHKNKKKKSHKRRREEDEDGHNSKRHKKDKSSVSLDSLAALDVEEALTQIYSRKKSV